MDFNLLSPVSNRLVETIAVSHNQTLGRKLKLHTAQSIPDLQGIDLAIVGVLERRNAESNVQDELQLNEIRNVFYALFPGNWRYPDLSS